MLDQHLRFKVDPGVHAQRFMARPGVAIRAAMLAAAIRVDAEAETDVGAIVLPDYGLGVVGQEDRRQASIVA